jgi:hypothetical protein
LAKSDWFVLEFLSGLTAKRRDVRSYYRSSTTDAYKVGQAWLVLFYYGDVFRHGKNSQYYVWCVRSGQ